MSAARSRWRRRRLHRSGAFNWAEPDWIFHPKAMWDPSDPLFGDTWHQAGGGVVGSIGAVAAWDTTAARA